MYSRFVLCLFFCCSSSLLAGDNTKKQIEKSETEVAKKEQQKVSNELYHDFPGATANVIELNKMKVGFFSKSLSPARYP